MLNVAIVGGGLSGLALANSLHTHNCDWTLFEARPRLGGRVLSVPRADGGSRVDLGPSWFWPDIQPRLAALIAQLGLATLEQHDSGTVLCLDDPDKSAAPVAFPDAHGGARRLAGGMVTLTDTLARKLPAERLCHGHALIRVHNHGNHVALVFAHAGREVIVNARHVVLALPPRLAARVEFSPPLDESLRATLEATPTWMADRAKVVIAYPRAHWREAGHAGNAFVTHEQAVIGEIYDACESNHAALGGFLALTPPLRAAFRDGLPMLLANQMAQVFGPALESGAQHYQDWAAEEFTCAPLDQMPAAPNAHLVQGHLLLRRPAWQGRLLFGGSESAAAGAGYLEGALDAATRIARELAPHVTGAAERATAGGNAACNARFAGWVEARRGEALPHYRRHLNQELAAQQREQQTQRALLATAEGIYSAALEEIGTLPLDTRGLHVERGRSALTPALLDPFDGFINGLIAEAVAFNRTSCALSNFPFEHAPDEIYLQAIKRDLVAAWREFALAANAAILARTPTPIVEAVHG